MLNPDRIETRIPLPALVLGVAGLIPFVGLPLFVVADLGFNADEALRALLYYAVVILSFMGGAQWGLAMRAPPALAGLGWLHYGVSVVPALVAWTALAFSMQAGLIVLASAFALLLAYDIWTIRRGLGPAWYVSLRLGLSAVVVTALCATATMLG